MVTGFSEKLLRDTKDANLAIFIENLACWIKFNASKSDPAERNYHEGRYWSYNTLNDFVKYFGFWSTQNLRTIINNCIKHGLILTNTFNKKKYDNTIWYTLTDKALEYYPILNGLFLNTIVRTNKTPVSSNNAIPEQHNSLGSNINITTSEFNNSPAGSSNDFGSLDDGNLSFRSDYQSNCHAMVNAVPERLVESNLKLKSDYQNNQTLIYWFYQEE